MGNPVAPDGRRGAVAGAAPSGGRRENVEHLWRRRHIRQRAAALLALATMATACGSNEGTPTATGDGERSTNTMARSTDSSSAVGSSVTRVYAATPGCADVLDVELRPESGRTYTVSVTVASADTGWEKYADAWEVRGPDGSVLGERVLTHPHVDEQPFTRSLSGVEIPDGVDRVVVAARDSVDGFCGETAEVTVP